MHPRCKVEQPLARAPRERIHDGGVVVGLFNRKQREDKTPALIERTGSYRWQVAGESHYLDDLQRLCSPRRSLRAQADLIRMGE
jgi:hypothetical protein